jgi:hypothetical protein
MQGRATSNAGTLRFLVILAAASAVMALVAARVPAPRGLHLWNLDLPKIDVPLAVFFHEALARGELPLWEDRLGLGFPLYAEGQIGAFYPPNWLIFKLSPLAALDVSRVLHLALAGTGAGLIALRLTGRRSGALVSAGVAVLGGAIVSKLEWTNFVAAYGWLPWVLLPLAGRSRPTGRTIVLASAAWGVQALAGHPNVWLLTGVAALVLLVAQRPFRLSLPRVVLFVVLGAALGAVQLLPTALLTTLSVRSAGVTPDDAFTSASTPFDLLAFGFAHPFIRTDRTGWDIYSVWYPDGIFALLEATAFVGLPVIALAMAGVAWRRARRWTLVGLVAATIPIVAAFRPGPWLAVPLLNGLRSPVRAYVVVAMVVGIVAAVGLAMAGRSVRSYRIAASSVAVLVLAYGATLGTARFLPGVFEDLLVASSTHLDPVRAAAARERAVAALAEPLPVTAEIILGAAAVVLLRPRRHRRSAALGLVALALAPLALWSPRINRLTPEAELWSLDSPLPTLLRGLRPHRVLTLDAPGFYEGSPDRLAASGVPDIDMFSSLNLSATDRLVADLRTGERAASLRRAVGIDVIVAFGKPCLGTPAGELPRLGAHVCGVADALRPPYWLPQDAVTIGLGVSSPSGPLSGLFAIWLFPRAREAMADVSRALGAARPATVTARRSAALDLLIDAPTDGWIYVDRAWWPGWQTRVDGRLVEVLSGLGGQFVPVPAGRHAVHQALVPMDALVGAGMGVAAIAAALVALAYQRQRPTRAQTKKEASPRLDGDEQHRT